MKKCSTSMAIKKCISKPDSDFISPQLEWPSSRAKTTNAGKEVAKEELLHTVGGNADQ
jgi:hypothetical protein